MRYLTVLFACVLLSTGVAHAGMKKWAVDEAKAQRARKGPIRAPEVRTVTDRDLSLGAARPLTRQIDRGGEHVAYQSTAHIVDPLGSKRVVEQRWASSEKSLLGGLVTFKRSAVIEKSHSSFGGSGYAFGTRQLSLGKNFKLDLPGMKTDKIHAFVNESRAKTE